VRREFRKGREREREKMDIHRNEENGDTTRHKGNNLMFNLSRVPALTSSFYSAKILTYTSRNRVLKGKHTVLD
jgi:hypothetical protein